LAGYRTLFGEDELIEFRNAQQVLLSSMEDDDFPGALHKVSSGDALLLRLERR
jgi:hypothetical protein